MASFMVYESNGFHSWLIKLVLLWNSPKRANTRSLGVAVKPTIRFFFVEPFVINPPSSSKMSCSSSNAEYISWWTSSVFERCTSSIRKATRIFLKSLPAFSMAFLSSQNFWMFTTMIRRLSLNAFTKVSWSVASTNMALSMFMLSIIESSWSRNCKRSTTSRILL